MSATSNRFSPVNDDVRPHPAGALVAVLLALSIAVLTTLRYWVLSAPYPPGLDGAQWLTFGRLTFGGPGRSAESAYAPLVPVVAHGLSVWLGPFLGLRILAALTLVLLAGATWLLCVRVLGLAWGSLAAALVLPCTAMTEPIFYGGYPQQAALAFGLFGIAGLAGAKGSEGASQRNRDLALAAAAFVLGSASHLLFGPLILASGALVAVFSSVSRPDQRRCLARFAIFLAPAAIVCVAVTMTYLGAGYSAPLAGTQRTIPEAWVYATREAPGLWAAILCGGVLSAATLVFRDRRRIGLQQSAPRIPDAVAVGLALALPSAILFIASGQPRLAPPLLMGGAILFTCALRFACQGLACTLPPILAGWIVVTIWSARSTTTIAHEFASFYQVLDASTIAATRSIPVTQDGALAVAADRRGWPVGWWVEALQEQPVYTGSDPQWLAFPDERTRADAVAQLLASPDGQILQQRAEALDVTYLVVRKWDWIGWDRWIDGDPNAPAVNYDDNVTIVLQIFPVTT